MGKQELDNLVQIGKLKAEAASRKEFDGMLASARRGLVDAQNESIETDSRINRPRPEERALARVSKDGHKRDRASGHPSRRRFAPPQDEVCGLSSIRPTRFVSWNRSTGRSHPLHQKPGEGSWKIDAAWRPVENSPYDFAKEFVARMSAAARYPGNTTVVPGFRKRSSGLRPGIARRRQRVTQVVSNFVPG
jgi:hypothetical protein